MRTTKAQPDDIWYVPKPCAHEAKCPIRRDAQRGLTRPGAHDMCVWYASTHLGVLMPCAHVCGTCAHALWLTMSCHRFGVFAIFK